MLISELFGKKVKDLDGWIDSEFGDGEDRVFRISKIVFEDDSEDWVEGEHDIAYILLDSLDQEVVDKFADEDDKGEEEEE